MDEEETVDEEAPFSLVTHVSTIHHLLSNVEVYINNQQTYNSNGLYAREFFFQQLQGSHIWIQVSFALRGYDYEGLTDETMEALLSESFFTKRMKMLSRPDGFLLYGKLGVDFFSTSEFIYPKMENRLRLIRARSNIHMISDNPNVCLGNVDCSLYTRRNSLKDDYHKKRKDMLAYTPVEFIYFETLAKTFNIPSRQNQFIQENIFNKAPVRRIAYAMNTNSAFTGS